MTGGRLQVLSFLLFAIQAYQYLVIVRIFLGWLPIEPPPAVRPAFNFLYDVTEPFLRIFRGLLPALNLGGMALDLSPIIGFFVLEIVQRLLVRAFESSLLGV